MVRFCMNELTTFRWSFEDDVHNYSAAGIRALSVWRPKLSDYGEEKGIDLLRETGMEVASLLWAGGFTGSDGRSYRDSVADARDAIRVAGSLRAGCLVLYSGARGGHTTNHARRLLRNAIHDLLPIADEFGVTLAIEPMHAACAAEWTFLTNLPETISLIKEFSHARLRLAFDAYHFGFDPESWERLEEFLPFVAIVQLGDGRRVPLGEQDRCRLGDGVVPLRDLIDRLNRADFGGFCDVELMGEEIEECDYFELLRQSKAQFECWNSR